MKTYTFSEVIKMLNANQVIEVYGGGNQVMKKTNSAEILSEFGSFENWLEQLISDHDLDGLVINVGSRNGNTWKDPKSYPVNLKTASIPYPAAREVQQPFIQPASDYVGLNGLPQSGDTPEMLRARLWALQDKYNDLKVQFTEARSDRKDLKKEKEKLREDLRTTERELDDLKYEMGKTKWWEKFLEKEENRELVEKIGLGFLQKGNDPAQLAGPGMTEAQKRVISFIQSNDDAAAQIVLGFIHRLTTVPGFHEKYHGLINLPENTQLKTAQG